MSDHLLEDLKQFITAAVSQSEERILDELRKQGQDMADRFAGIGEALEEVHHISEVRDTAVDKRLTKLEQQTV